MPTSLNQISQALETFADLFGDRMVLDDIGPRLTCSEAEAFAAVLQLSNADAADVFLESHARGDDDPNDIHHAQYIDLRGVKA